MVEVVIYMEGGTTDQNSPKAKTNTTLLRRAFHKLLANAIDTNKLDIIIEMRGGYFQTMQGFQREYPTNTKSYILMDLDAAPNKRKERLNDLHTSFSKWLHQEWAATPENERLTKIDAAFKTLEEHLFFMVQAMEAWFLSQPTNIELCFSNLTKTVETPLAEDKKLKNKNVQTIAHPDDALKVLLRNYYEIAPKTEKTYNKITDGATLLEKLDIEKLQHDFEDVQRLVATLQQASA